VRLTWWKWAAVIGNLLIVSYLIHRIMLDARAKCRNIDENQPKPTLSTAARAKPVADEVPR
jgi:hypothetical protein